jgi:predicted nucleic acid-binding protein
MLRRHRRRTLWPRAWELRGNLSSYDALSVALAEGLSLPVLSTEGRLAQAAGLVSEVIVP